MRLAPQEIRTYFVTTVTAQRRRLFQVEDRAELLLDVFRSNRAQGRLQIHAFVFMPDHIHLLLTPAPDVSLEKAMQFLKGGFSFRLKSKLDVWERSFNEENIRDAQSFETRRAYIESNPVCARLVDRPEAFAFSSAGRPNEIDPVPPWLCKGTARG